MNILFIVFLFFSTTVSAFTLPAIVDLVEHPLNLSLSFDIEAEGRILGNIHRRLLSSRTEYDLYDRENYHLASAKVRLDSPALIFDLVDGGNNSLGRVEERSSFFFPTFALFSSQEELQLIGEIDFWGTRYTIKEPREKKIIAFLIRARESWRVEIIDELAFQQININPALFITVMALEADRGCWRPPTLF